MPKKKSHIKKRNLKLAARSLQPFPYHHPVMLREAIEGLRINPTATYVDATFGGGGHSMAILENLKSGRLIAFDQDEDAEKEAAGITHRSFSFCRANFMYIKEYLHVMGLDKVNGVLADLGVSSHQLDTPSRGFSIRANSALDMRMDVNLELTAARVLNEYKPADLLRVFGTYGELRNARTVTRRVMDRRKKAPFTTTSDLKTALSDLAPKGGENKYFAQVFQALRIEVNEEMKALEKFLNQCAGIIGQGGRLVVLAYHSLEDRMIKNYFNKGKFHGEADKDIYGNVIKPFVAITRKPIRPSEKEIEENPRARSAKMRIGERTNDGELNKDRRAA